MKITGPLFKWFGSKWLSSRHYGVPNADEIIEPFAGGGGYSLRYFDRKVTIAEADSNLYALWHWLTKEATEAQVREIPLDLTEGTDIRTIGLNLGQQLLLKHWQRTNNVGNCWTISPWGNKPGQWTANTRSRVASEFHLIRHWEVYNDAFALLADKRDADAMWFIDPPYQFNYGYATRPVSYPRLAEAVMALRGRAIVCEAQDPKTGERPTWLPFETFRDTVTSRRKAHQSHHSKELVYRKE
jgi:site-specific DNA-adenine methylase